MNEEIPRYDKRYKLVKLNLTFVHNLTLTGKGDYVEMVCLEDRSMKWLGDINEFKEQFVECGNK